MALNRKETHRESEWEREWSMLSVAAIALVWKISSYWMHAKWAWSSVAYKMQRTVRIHVYVEQQQQSHHFVWHAHRRFGDVTKSILRCHALYMYVSAHRRILTETDAYTHTNELDWVNHIAIAMICVKSKGIIANWLNQWYTHWLIWLVDYVSACMYAVCLVRDVWVQVHLFQFDRALCTQAHLRISCAIATAHSHARPRGMVQERTMAR